MPFRIKRAQLIVNGGWLPWLAALKEDVKSFARFSTTECELFRHNLENPLQLRRHHKI